MTGLAWGGKLAVDHDDAFVQLEVQHEGDVITVTLEPDTARRIARALVAHADAMIPRSLTR